MSYRIGIDVGGTFTDCVLRRPDGSRLLEKAPTTPQDQSDGVLAGLAQLAAAEGLPLAELLAQTRTIVHGTTTGDNALIQMKGAPTGLLVTEGFRDEIEFRRCFKEDIWDPAAPPPSPIARRRVRLEIAERMTAEGEVETPLDEEGVRKATARLRAFGVTSIAVCFLHSFLNPDHERRARDIILGEFPDVEMVSLSHEVLPKPPEFERTSTTLVNAFVGPPIARYLERLTGRLAAAGFTHELLVATSAGGVATADAAARRAVATIGSGPTGGVIAAVRAGREAGLGDVVSVDMGGTSYDLCLIRGGRPEVKMDWNWRHRYCIGIPMVDIPSVGAGGGSIAWEDAGVLHVGPQSAGSEPGPVSYGRGGTDPTVTDADLVLGRLDTERFAGGRMQLDRDAAAAALAGLGSKLGLDAEATAAATVRLVDAHMTDAIRRVLSLAGADPRRLDLVAFGGMGGVHATTQAAALGMRRVLVPSAAPGLSALGLLTADHVIDDSRGYIVPWQEADTETLSRLARELEDKALRELANAGVPAERIRLEWSILLVYPGQTFDAAIAVAVPTDVGAAVTEFHRRNEEARLIEARAQEPIVRGIRLTAVGEVAKIAPVTLQRAAAPAPLGRRDMWAGGVWQRDAPYYDFSRIGPGPSIEGPAAVQSPFTTVILRPGDTARVTDGGDLLIDIAAVRMKFGIAFANIGPFVESAPVVTLAEAAEAAGFESIWTVDHVVVPAGYRSEYPYDPSGKLPSGEATVFPDPLVWLSYVAARTATLRLGTGILIVPQRNPLVLAKELATLDHLSGGRMILGAGIGWLEEEFEALGVPFAGRGQRTEEAIAAMRALWSQEQASFEGVTTAFRDCFLRPQPPGGSIPVHVGGHSDAAARRAGRIGDGFFPLGVTGDDLVSLLEVMRRSAEEAGRDPATMEVTVPCNVTAGEEAVAAVAELERLGATRVIVPAVLFREDLAGSLTCYGADVIGRY